MTPTPRPPRRRTLSLAELLAFVVLAAVACRFARVAGTFYLDWTRPYRVEVLDADGRRRTVRATQAEWLADYLARPRVIRRPSPAGRAAPSPSPRTR